MERLTYFKNGHWRLNFDGCDMVFTLDDCTTSDDDIARAWNRRVSNGEVR